jgi:hypothetical protein
LRIKKYKKWKALNEFCTEKKKWIDWITDEKFGIRVKLFIEFVEWIWPLMHARFPKWK